jgi:hypothetical protein
MSQATKLKYIINYNHATFNPKTKKYETKQGTYDSLKEVKANQWRCEKCQYQVGTYNKLIIHKSEYHSY